MRKIINWFKELGKESSSDELPVAPDLKISEPIFVFVEYFKANPKNFSIKLTYDSYYDDFRRAMDCHVGYRSVTRRRTYVLKDKSLGDEWTVNTEERHQRYFGPDPDTCFTCEILEHVKEVEFNMTMHERYYLTKELKPLLSRDKAKERLHRMRKSAEERAAKAEAQRQLDIREKYYQKYKEQL